MANPARLRELAATCQDAINHAFNPNRQTNTPKRARQAAEARIDGRRMQRVQAALLGLAIMHEAGTCPDVLLGLETRGKIYDLLGAKITHEGGYYDAGHDHNEPSVTTPAALALWALATGSAPDAMQAETQRRRIEALKFAQIPGYFPTPAAIIDQMLDLAELPAGEFTALEPSAGHGAIADAIKERAPQVAITACEINHSLRQILTAKGHCVAMSDFMTADWGENFDRILMNPPFERGQDIEHTMHAYGFLSAGGIMVSILSIGVMINTTAKALRFRDWLDQIAAEAYPIPAGAFKESGTDVATVMIVAVKPRALAA